MNDRHRRLVASLLVMLSAVAAADGPSASAGEVSQAELLAQVQEGTTELVILDVRTPEEYAAGHIPGARNVPVDQVEARLPALEELRSGEVVVYCRSGRRAAMAIDVLRNAGFERVRHLEGDISEWESARLPVETGSQPESPAQ